jgi:hypothetical protein
MDARITVREGRIIDVSWPGVLQAISFARKEADDAVYFTIPFGVNRGRALPASRDLEIPAISGQRKGLG